MWHMFVELRVYLACVAVGAVLGCWGPGWVKDFFSPNLGPPPAMALPPDYVPGPSWEELKRIERMRPR